MALQFDGVTVGAMQYNGVTIGEAMIDGVVVYRSIITVTPAAPTFLDAAPWIELPTVEGVIYTVTGTPGAGGTVTVTAAADEGYQLDGDIEWVHTYPSPYPMSGEWSGTFPTYPQSLVLATHTIQTAGIYLIEWMLTVEASYVVAEIETWEGSTRIDQARGDRSGFGGSSTATLATSLDLGTVVEFRLYDDGDDVLYPGTGSWSITPA